MTIHPDLLDLIHADIDGAISDQDRARLRDAMTQDAAVREEYRRLRGLGDLLSQVDRAEPPAELAQSVMRKVRARQAYARTSVLGRLRAAWPGRTVAVRYAYAVAAGVVIGVLGLQWSGMGGPAASSVPEGYAAGTLTPGIGAARLDLAPAGVRGVATMRHFPSGTAIGVDLSGSEPVELVLRYDPARERGHVDLLVMRDGKATSAGTFRSPQRN
jgi:anti-sigma factor RsiW